MDLNLGIRLLQKAVREESTAAAMQIYNSNRLAEMAMALTREKIPSVSDLLKRIDKQHSGDGVTWEKAEEKAEDAYNIFKHKRQRKRKG